MSQNTIAFLGVKGGPAIRPGSCMPTSFLLEIANTQIVIDCGLGVTRGLVDKGFHLEQLSTIIISHCHSDHYLELGPLIHTAWTAGLTQKVSVYGPTSLLQYWEHFYQSMAFDIGIRIVDEGRIPLKELVEIKPIPPDLVVELERVRITLLRNAHPPINDSFAIRFDCDTGSMAYSGDTRYFEPLIYLARDVDLLIHEVMLASAIDELCHRVGNTDGRLKAHLLRSHTTVEEAAKIAYIAQAKKLAFCHYIPGDIEFRPEDWIGLAQRQYRGPIVAPRDGDVIPFGI